jgi:hypothetical protein
MDQGQHVIDGRYAVETRLGDGTSAVVYLAIQTNIRRPVALKIMRSGKNGENKAWKRYLGEAQTLASLKHPNIVTVYDVGHLEGGEPYIAMEYVHGYTLLQRLRRDGPLPLDLAFRVFEGIASGLGHAHRQGIVHRDVKPANILMQRGSVGYDIPKIADFGVALVHAGDEREARLCIGTPAYMSPEQASSEPATPASDLYSLGVVMFRCLTGQLPFSTSGGAKMSIRHVTDPVPAFSDITDRDIPASLEAVVRKCLEKRPEDRYRSALDLLAALDMVRNPTPIMAPRRLKPAPQLLVGWMALSMALSALSWGLGAVLSEPSPVRGAEVITVLRDEVRSPPLEGIAAELAPVVEPVERVIRRVTPDPLPPIEALEPSPEPMTPEVAAAWSAGQWSGEMDGRPLAFSLEHDGKGSLSALLKVRGLLKKRRQWKGGVIAYSDGDLRLHLEADAYEITGRIAEVYASGVVLLDDEPVGSWWARRR